MFDGVICKNGDGPVKVGQIVDVEDSWRTISPAWGNVLAFKDRRLNKWGRNNAEFWFIYKAN